MPVSVSIESLLGGGTKLIDPLSAAIVTLAGATVLP
jgi:hypothetical protein